MTGRLTRREMVAGVGLVTVGALLPTARAATGSGVWIPGDLHTHTWYSHDVYGGPGDENTGLDEAYTLGLSVAGQFAAARERGLRYLAITDHNDVRSVADLRRGARGLIAIPAYEASIKGHAQMLGARKLYPVGDQAPDAIRAMARALRADGGVFQANHPAYRNTTHWTYGFHVRPDTVEVWNPTVARSIASEAFWESWLERGVNVGATGGSDNHWLVLQAVQGPGQPTTWVYVRERSARGVLDALRHGRTTIAHQPPVWGGRPLLLDAPGYGIVGDIVRPGTELRVHGLRRAAIVRVRANGDQLLEERVEAGEELRFKAPRDSGWVRAYALDPTKLPDVNNEEITILAQRDGYPLLALTSPIYVRRSRRAP